MQRKVWQTIYSLHAAVTSRETSETFHKLIFDKYSNTLTADPFLVFFDPKNKDNSSKK